MKDQRKRPRWAIPLAVFVVVFGLLTLKSGGEVLFVDGAGREAAGSYVPFVLWFNFLAGFAYIAAAVGLALWRSWAAPLAAAIALLTIAVFAAFALHVFMGGAYESRTVGAMIFRVLVWLGVALIMRGKFKGPHNALPVSG